MTVTEFPQQGGERRVNFARSVTRSEQCQRLAPMENTAVGVASGIIDVSLTQSLIYSKNCMQQGLHIEIDPRIMYRGFGA